MKSEISEQFSIISRYKTLPKKEQLKLLLFLIKDLKGEKRVEGFSALGEELFLIPIGVFSSGKLSALEAMVKFLKEERHLRFTKIGILLNRNVKTIWATYSSVLKKMPEPFPSLNDSVEFPASLICDRSLSVFEHIVVLLKKLGHTNHEIGLLLRRDDRTIWSVYHRAKKKLGVRS